ncbi:MAG: RNA polymerase-binding protein DksA [Desulfobacterales bacterium]|nr:MAG: RNA polymerase-binding protein DksA [Desulfobacterales bacterium]
MKNYDLEYFRRILTQRLDDLLKKGDEETYLLRETTVDSSDFMDQAAMETDQSFRLRMRDREKKLMLKINQALTRIEEGAYGICEVCGEEISIKRLKARPVATYCIGCKNRMEALERAVGV